MAACSLFPLAKLCADSSLRGDWRAGGDPVTRHERRFAELRGALPSGVSAVGYVSDPPLTQGHIAATKEYVMTVYALAPVVVDPEAEHPYVVGNFTGPPFRLPLDTRLVVRRDFGDGVFLFRMGDR